MRKVPFAKVPCSCVVCDKEIQTKLVCSRCRAVAYCGTECQKAGWLSHREVCTENISPTEAVLLHPHLALTRWMNALSKEGTFLETYHFLRTHVCAPGVATSLHFLKRMEDSSLVYFDIYSLGTLSSLETKWRERLEKQVPGITHDNDAVLRVTYTHLLPDSKSVSRDQTTTGEPQPTNKLDLSKLIKMPITSADGKRPRYFFQCFGMCAPQEGWSMMLLKHDHPLEVAAPVPLTAFYLTLILLFGREIYVATLPPSLFDDKGECEPMAQKMHLIHMLDNTVIPAAYNHLLIRIMCQLFLHLLPNVYRGGE